MSRYKFSVIQYDNRGAIVATQTLARQLDIGLFCEDMAQLGTQLRDRDRMNQLRGNVRESRSLFTFDYHVDELLAFFARVINECKPSASVARRSAAMQPRNDFGLRRSSKR